MVIVCTTMASAMAITSQSKENIQLTYKVYPIISARMQL